MDWKNFNEYDEIPKEFAVEVEHMQSCFQKSGYEGKVDQIVRS